MTTLADINETLAKQSEMQEKTNKAIESLSKRLVGFSRVAKGDKLEELENRREARRKDRVSGFAGAARGFASTAKENIGLLSKILGGLALGAFVLQNDELRESFIKFVEEAGDGLSSFFKSEEFRETLNAAFEAGGEVFGSVLGAIWETDGGKLFIGGLAAIWGLPIIVNAIAGAFAAARLLNPGISADTPGTRRTPTGGAPPPVKKGGIVGQLARGLGYLSAATVLIGAFLDKRGTEAGMNFGEKAATGTFSLGASTVDFATSLGSGLLNSLVGTNLSGTNLKEPTENFFYGQKELANELENLTDKYNSGVGLTTEEKARLMGISEFNLRLNKLTGTAQQREVATDILNIQDLYNKGVGDDPFNVTSPDYINKLLAPKPENSVSVDEFMNKPLKKPAETFMPAFYLDRIIRMINKSYTPPAKSSLEYDNLMRQHLMFMNSTDADLQSSIRTKLGALKQGIESTGVATIALAPMIISGQSGKGSNTTQSPSTTIVPNVAAAGETNHISFGQSGEQVVYGLPRIALAT